MMSSSHAGSRPRYFSDTPGSSVVGPSASRWLMTFGIVYAALDLAPSFLTSEAGPQLTIGDLVNVAAPLIVVALAWKLYDAIRNETDGVDVAKVRRGTIALGIFSALHVEGEGMHVAANAVTRQLSASQGSPAWRIGYFFDEGLGHVVTNAGLVGMSLVLLALGARLRPRPPSAGVLVAAGCFGFAWFVDGVEGRTVPLMLPAALFTLGAILLRARKGATAVATNVVQLFYLAAFSIALAMFLVWWVWQGGFPEFSQLGWI